MKFQLLLVAALAVAAFAAPVPEYVDPDCIEDEQMAEEPAPEINAEFALGVPDLVWQGENNVQSEDECEDDAPAAAPTPAPEECEDPLTSEPPQPTTAEEECVDEPIATTAPPAPAAPAATEAEECQDDPIVTTEADECAEDGPAVENAPILHDIVVEPAMVESNPIIISEEHMMPDIEECEEY